MKNFCSPVLHPGRGLPLLVALLLSLPTLGQQLVGRAAPTVAARQQVLREALRLAPTTDLRPTETEPDQLGFLHEQYQLYYQGVKVEHGLVRVHSRAGKVEAVSGEAPALPAGLAVQPGLSEAAALQRALAAVGARRYKWQLPAEEAALQQQTGQAGATYRPKGELVLVSDYRQPAAQRPLVLAWKFNIYAHEPVSRAWYYVDARSGQVVLRDDIIKHANAPGATFATRYVGPRTSTTDNTGAGYRLRETVTGRGVTTLNVRKGNTFSAAIDFVDNDNNWTAAEHDNANFDNAALDAHLGAQITQDYWTNVHGRDSYDDRGSVLLSYVHYDDTPATTAGTDNAFWNGTAMLYGDGNTQFKPLTAIDVCGHEIGHAVCQTTANLVYANESGAMNEGFSDIWGACVEHHLDPAKQIWLIGEDICKPSFGAALRSMSNPNQFNQPDTYKGTMWFTGTGDNGGVHYNSGVLNYWFYLLTVGGSGTNDKGTSFSVTGITIAKSQRIAYRAERFYLAANAQYADARKATLQAAIDLYGLGSAEATAVAQAWRAVGVGTPTGALEGAPTITGFSPASGPTGTVVTITGTNLGAAYKVTFNGVDAIVATLGTGTNLTVTVPGTATTGLISLTTASGTATTSALTPASFTVNAPGQAPTIGSYAPAAGQVQGGAVTLTGTNFTGATAVRFNGTAATFSVVNATTISATVPAGAASGPLSVTTPNGTATAPTSFTVLPGIASFSPASGAVGSTVTLTGTSFTGALNVKFNGVYASSFSVVNATTITAVVPNGAATGPITVRTPSGTATSPTSFTVTASLAFTSFSPGSGAVGAVINLQGWGFTGASTIAFNGVNAPTFTVVSDLEIWATVPAGAQSGNIVVTTPLGAATSPRPFTVVVPGGPTISSFTPTNGPVGAAVTLTGTNFTGTTAVRFNGTAATFAVTNSTTINTSVPAGATTGLLSVTNAVATAYSNTAFALPPANDQCSGSLPALTCGSTVTGTTVAATATGDPTATCGGNVPGAGVFYQLTGTGGPITVSGCAGNAYDMTMFVYTGSCGAYTCVVSDDDFCGTGSSSSVTFASVAGTTYLVFVSGFEGAQGAFTLTTTCGTPSTITSFTPTSGGSGTVVNITGTLLTDATAVRFNGLAASSFTINSATSVTATVPASAVTGPISVATPNGTAVSSTDFTVAVGPPTISSFTPTSGTPGTAVTITGTNFSGTTAVRFNGTAATFAVTNNTTISTSVPAGASTGPLSLTTPSGTATSVGSFTVLLPPANDQCAAAGLPVLACGATVTGTTLNSAATGDPTGSCTTSVDANAGGVFYRFVGPGGNVTLSTCHAATTYDTKLFVYTGTCGNYVCVVGNDDRTGNCTANGSGTTSELTFASVAGVDYLVFVSGFNGAKGNFGLTATCAAPPPAISSFSPTSGVSGTSVTLTGTGLSGASAVTVNGVATTPASVTATSLSFTVPAGCAGTQSITVTSPAGTSAANATFTVRLRTSTTGTAPAVNALAAGRAGSALTVGFSEPVNAASLAAARVYSAQTGGNKNGAWTTSGNTASFASVVNGLVAAQQDFRAGEVVSVTVPATVTGAGGMALGKQVYQFTTATGGAGRGGFDGGTTPTMGGSINGLALGDVNGDGLLDLLTANYSSAGAVNVALNNGSGGYLAPTAVSVGSYPIVVGLADVNADGALDLVTCNYGNPSGTGTTASVALNTGTGAFGAATSLSTGNGPRGLTFGDVDADGDLDLLIAVANGVTVWQNNGAGSFTLNATLTGMSFSTGLVLGDVDGDGDLDMAVNSYNNNSGTVVYIHLNDGNGTFTAAADVPVARGPFVALLGDVDADGDLDLVSSSESTSTVSIRLNNGLGTFSTPATNSQVGVGASPIALALGDVDADGDLDLVSGSPSAGLSVRINNGSGVFAAPFANGTVPGSAGFVALADMDGDGDLDVASAANTSTVDVRLNSASIPLPVALLDFAARAEGAAVRLSWRTAQELNNARFEVERSPDGQRFARIGEVAGQGTSTRPTDYAFLDNEVPKTPGSPAPIFYRLRQVDRDGTATFSEVRAVTPGTAPTLALYPNPARTAVTVTGAAPGAPVTVLDALGRRVAQAPADAAGTARLRLPAGLPSGVYVVRAGAQARRLTVE